MAKIRHFQKLDALQNFKLTQHHNLESFGFTHKTIDQEQDVRAFHNTAYSNVADIGDAYNLLAPVLGVTLASTAFAVALFPAM